VAALELKVKKPAGLKTRPTWLPRFFAGGGIVLMLSSRFLLAPPYSLSIIEADPAEDVYSDCVSNSLATHPGIGMLVRWTGSATLHISSPSSDLLSLSVAPAGPKREIWSSVLTFNLYLIARSSQIPTIWAIPPSMSD
jgi:hypothetical protein